MLDFSTPLAQQLIIYPSITVIGLLILNIALFTQEKNDFSKIQLLKVVIYIIIMGALSTAAAVYCLITFANISSVGVASVILDKQAITNFLYFIYSSIALHSIVLFIGLKAIHTNITKYPLYMTLSIIGMAVAEIPAIFGLIYIFKILGAE